jgi:hypothetical protein
MRAKHAKYVRAQDGSFLKGLCRQKL